MLASIAKGIKLVAKVAWLTVLNRKLGFLVTVERQQFAQSKAPCQ
jgi:hypothetical protein